jgi:thiol-disulfide isomerase/thioredoxin
LTGLAAFVLLGFVVVTGAPADEPKPAKGTGRVFEGIVVTTARKPVHGAKLAFVQDDPRAWPVGVETATTNAQGRYRADLGRFPWSTGPVQVIVLAHGFKAVERKLPAGGGAVTAEFDLEARAWKETHIRLEEPSGKPIADVDITCSMGGAPWSRLKTDRDGRCQIALAPRFRATLLAAPQAARPIEVNLSGTDDEPTSITLPVVPPITGRVLDHEGRPVPGVALGRWITFWDDGGEALPFLDGATAVTDRDGRFVIAPRIILRKAYLTNPRPFNRWLLCFADPSFRRIAYRLFDAAGAVEPMDVTLQPARRVHIPIVHELGIAPSRKTDLDVTISVAPRADMPEWRPILISGQPPRKQQATQGAQGTFVEEYLPEGTYWLDATLFESNGGSRLGEFSRELVVPRGDGPLELPPLTLEPTAFDKMAGRPAPEIDATDLATGRPVKLADFRGKVVVLDFWGHWCGPCVGNMPHLMALQQKFADQPLAILALHDRSVQSRAEYDQKIATARERVWGGRDLPFPVLLDRPDPEKPADLDPVGTGTTIKRYGITGFPTLFVIDQNGIMVSAVRSDAHDHLSSLVRELLERPKAR